MAGQGQGQGWGQLWHLAVQRLHAQLEVELEGWRIDAALARPQQRWQAARDRRYLQPRPAAVDQHVLHLASALRLPCSGFEW